MGISPEFSYFRLGTEQSGNLHLWHAAIELQAARVKDAVALNGELGDQHRLDADAHFLLVAVRNGLRLATLLLEWRGDLRLREALADFARRFPDAQNVRDVLTHIDEYVLDRGRLQRKGEIERGSSSWRATKTDGEVVLIFGPYEVPLLATAAAAGELMSLACEVWLQGLRDNVDKLDEPANPA